MNASHSNRARIGRALKVILPLAVLGAGVVVALMVLESRPTAPRAEPTERQARLVTVTPAEAASPTITLDANGTVEAADSTTLRPRVSGQVVALEDRLAPGTRFEQGDVLARIDDTDYRLALNSAQTDLANARAALRVEQGQQAVAERELALVGTEVSDDERDLALRGPQLEQARAEVEAARTAVEQAQLDLDRTAVRAPFDGIVSERSASVGDVVATSDSLATLAATDVYWVDVSVPVDQLRWIHDAGPQRSGSPARVRYPEAWGPDVSIAAEVLRIQPALETAGRMARVLLRVPDPLGANAPDSGPQLLIGAYVTAGIEADIPADSVAIDSGFLHENDQVWVMTADAELDIRTVDVVYRDAIEAIVASGLDPGDAVVTSDLTAPIQGMPVRVQDDAPHDPTENPAAAVREDEDETAAGDDVHDRDGLDLRLSTRLPIDRPDPDAGDAPRS